ncbi:MAG: hypothetical protein ABI867_19295 [Kofleriaceae bacterium]
MRAISLVALNLFVFTTAACGGGGDECTVDTSYDPAIAAASFATDVTNPLFPLVPGTVWIYEGGGERVEVTVTNERKTLLGISAIVVHDVGSLIDGGDVIEDTFDYYAQDLDGNVWYMGEDTKELENGQIVSTEGSWEAGVDGAKPGILIPATPIIGQPYRQEYLACEAEDFGKVAALDQSVTDQTGTHDGCLQTLDTTPLEPDVQEHKFYCPGVGLALTIDLNTNTREELISQSAP